MSGFRLLAPSSGALLMQQASDLIEIRTSVGAWATEGAHIVARIIPIVLIAVVPSLIADWIGTRLAVVDRVNCVSLCIVHAEIISGA